MLQALQPLAQGGRIAMQYLPTIMAVGSALPSIRQGNYGQALLQGAIGYGTGMPLKGLVPGVARAASAQAPRLAGTLLPNLVDAPGFNVAAKQLARAGVGLGAAGLAFKGGQMLGGSGAAQGIQQAGGNLAQTGAGVIGYTADGKPVYGNIGGGALPPGMGQYGPTSPYGGPLDVLGPAGMGQRLQTLKDAQTQRDVFRTLMPEVMEVREATAKKDFERNMAAAGIRQNIRTRAEMQRAAQDAGLRAGLGALQQAGTALTNQYQYQ